MSGPQFMPFYVGDYLRDTSHLSAEQHGVYLLLLMACWTHGRLPDSEDQLVAIAKISRHKWKKFHDLFEKFFTKKSDGFWHQKRIDKERYRLEKISTERSKAGSKGGSKTQANAKQTSSKRQARARYPHPQPEPGSPPPIVPPPAHGGGDGGARRSRKSARMIQAEAFLHAALAPPRHC